VLVFLPAEGVANEPLKRFSKTFIAARLDSISIKLIVRLLNLGKQNAKR
jgi:hypothetical protein